MSSHADMRLGAGESLIAYALSLVMLLTVAPFLYQSIGLSAMVVSQLGFIAGPAVALSYLRAPNPRSIASLIGLRRASLGAWIGAAFAGISFWYLNLTFVAPIADKYLGGEQLAKDLGKTVFSPDIPIWVTLFTVAVLPALCEELLLRGALARSLVPRFGAAGAIIGSALLFGAMHIYPAQILTATMVGLVLGYAAVVSGSVGPAMLLHFLNNAVVILLAGQVSPTLTGFVRTRPEIIGPCALLACVAGCVLIWLGRKAIS